jgi:lipoprotein-releasing system permease protein
VNRTPHIRLYNEIQASKNQPIDLSKEYKGHYNFIRSVKPKNERAQIHNCPAMIKALDNDDRVLGYAPKIVAQVFYNVGDIDLTGVINGVNVDEEARLFKFKDYGFINDNRRNTYDISAGKAGITIKIDKK